MLGAAVGGATLAYPDAPHPASGPPQEPVRRFFVEQPYYEWWDAVEVGHACGLQPYALHVGMRRAAIGRVPSYHSRTACGVCPMHCASTVHGFGATWGHAVMVLQAAHWAAEPDRRGPASRSAYAYGAHTMPGPVWEGWRGGRGGGVLPLASLPGPAAYKTVRAPHHHPQPPSLRTPAPPQGQGGAPPPCCLPLTCQRQRPCWPDVWSIDQRQPSPPCHVHALSMVIVIHVTRRAPARPRAARLKCSTTGWTTRCPPWSG